MTATDTQVVTHEAPAAKEHRVAATIARFRPGVIAIVTLIIFGLTTIRNSDFSSGSSIQAILSIASIYMLLAIGETMVIITRNVDLSVGSTLGLSAFTVGEMFNHNPHTSIVLAFVVGIAVGAACGLVIGIITTLIRVPSLVVTLAALYIIRGLVNILGTGVQIEPSVFPNGMVSLGYSTIIGIPWLFVIVVVIALVAAFWMYAFPAGARALRHRLESTGRSTGRYPHHAARLPGVRDQRRSRWARWRSVRRSGGDRELHCRYRIRVDHRHGSRRWRGCHLWRQRAA